MELTSNPGENIEDIRKVFTSWVSQSRGNIRLSTGLTSGKLFQYEDVREAFENVAPNLSKIDVLFDSSVNVQAARIATPWLFELPHAEFRQSKTRVPHWLIVDDRKFRLEKPHDIGVATRSNVRISDPDPVMIRILTLSFDRMWNSSPKV